VVQAVRRTTTVSALRNADACLDGTAKVPFEGAIMQPQHHSKILKKNIRIQCSKYLLRTIKEDDASDRWASWMSEPEVMYQMNLSPRNWTKDLVLQYIRQFDQRLRLLIGIFEKQTWKHIGVLTINIDCDANSFHVTELIGDPEYRNKGVTHDITVPFREYFFETLGFDRMNCMVLSHNRPIIHYLTKTGWHLVDTRKHHVKSATNGTMLDVCFFSLSQDAWHAWKKAHPST
jgi:RimJ/RimL family protein N-acetyltransferase